MKYTDFQLIWRFESMIFKAKYFFRERSLHMAVHKLRGTSFTLRHAGRKKYFNDFIHHFEPKNGINFWEHDFPNFVHYPDRLAKHHKASTQDTNSTE